MCWRRERVLRINATAKIGIIRVLTTDDIHLLNMHGTLIEALFPNLDVVSRCIPDHPKGVYESETEASAGPLVVRLAREFEAENCSAVIISCASDPGLDMARKNVGIPVIGAGEAAALMGRAFGRKVGVLGIGGSTPKRMEKILGDLLVGYAKPEGVENTTNLLTAESQRAVLDAGLKLKQAGAEVIVLACTGLSTAGSAAPLSKATGLRVVDAVQAAGFLAYYAVTF
jgi:allantoin racemase